jgi:hypothetical protein
MVATNNDTEEQRIAAIWAKVQADESPCCDGAKIDAAPLRSKSAGWFACMACRLPRRESAQPPLTASRRHRGSSAEG